MRYRTRGLVHYVRIPWFRLHGEKIREGLKKMLAPLSKTFTAGRPSF